MNKLVTVVLALSCLLLGSTAQAQVTSTQAGLGPCLSAIDAFQVSIRGARATPAGLGCFPTGQLQADMNSMRAICAGQDLEVLRVVAQLWPAVCGGGPVPNAMADLAQWFNRRIQVQPCNGGATVCPPPPHHISRPRRPDQCLSRGSEWDAGTRQCYCPDLPGGVRTYPVGTMSVVRGGRVVICVPADPITGIAPPPNLPPSQAPAQIDQALRTEVHQIHRLVEALCGDGSVELPEERDANGNMRHPCPMLYGYLQDLRDANTAQDHRLDVLEQDMRNIQARLNTHQDYICRHEAELCRIRGGHMEASSDPAMLCHQQCVGAGNVPQQPPQVTPSPSPAPAPSASNGLSSSEVLAFLRRYLRVTVAGSGLAMIAANNTQVLGGGLNLSIHGLVTDTFGLYGRLDCGYGVTNMSGTSNLSWIGGAVGLGLFVTPRVMLGLGGFYLTGFDRGYHPTGLQDDLRLTFIGGEISVQGWIGNVFTLGLRGRIGTTQQETLATNGGLLELNEVAGSGEIFAGITFPGI